MKKINKTTMKKVIKAAAKIVIIILVKFGTDKKK